MTIRIAVLSNSDSQWLEDVIRKVRDVQVVFNPPILTEASQETAAIIFNCLDSVEIAGRIEQIEVLRCHAGFKGMIILLSFLPIHRVISGAREKALSSLGCRMLRAPFLLSDLAPVVEHEIELSSQELQKVCQTIEIIDAASALNKLSHDYTNQFSVSLIHLGQIERFSYRSNLEPSIILGEIQKISDNLTLEKVNGFHTELASLLKRFRAIISQEQLQSLALASEQLCEETKDWVKLMHPLQSARKVNLEAIFQQCRQIQLSIINLNSIIASLRTTFEAEAQVQDDQQDTIP